MEIEHDPSALIADDPDPVMARPPIDLAGRSLSPYVAIDERERHRTVLVRAATLDPETRERQRR
jgi:hypothetical protein